MKQTIGKAVKKPVEVNYFIYNGWSATTIKELEAWVKTFGKKFHEVFEFGPLTTNIKVKTLEGTSYNVPNGYYILRGVKGEFYPCDPQIFKETYSIS